MGPLVEWLGNTDLATFRRRYLRREALSGASRARRIARAFGWSELGVLLGTVPEPDILVVSRGKMVAQRAPRDLTALRALFARGIGVVVRHPQHHSAIVRELCSAFEVDLPGEQRVLIFATPGGTHGFGWHYDPEDVFVVQTEGDKEYYFRRNTLVPSPARHGQPDFSIHGLETSALMTCRLLPGDWLYLPRAFWHVAYPREDSLSISIGVFPQLQQAEAVPAQG